MSRELNIDAYRRDKELLINLKGRLVLDSCQEAKVRLGSFVNVNIDTVYVLLADLDFLDSAGLGVFVGLKQIVNRNRATLQILNPSGRVEEVFRVSKLDTIFELRSGAEAELISSTLRRPEYCLWSDAKDGPQANKTEAHFTGVDAANLTGYMEAPGEGQELAAQIRQWCDNAVQLIKQGDYPRAIDEYMRVLAKDPENLTALNNLGIVYEKRSAWYSQARETWDKVLAISKRHNDSKHAERAVKHLEALARISG